MARIALGVTLLFLLVTCFFGFETRSKVQGYADQMDELKSTASAAQQQVATAVAKQKAAQEALGKAQADLSAANDKATADESAVAAANGQVNTLNQQVQTLQQQLTAIGQKPQVAPTPVGPSPDEEKLTAQLKDAQAQVAELTEVKETLTNKEKDAESRADDLQKTVDHYKDNTIRNGLEGEVLAYNPGYNFVVLSIGDRQGAVTNAEMILTRGDTQIGKVRITSVEPSTSVADVIPGSLARGVRVQPGDRVIFPGS